MSTKTIAIMEDVYTMLKSLQKPQESFSEEIRRLVSDRGKISRFAGAWKDVGDKEARDMKESIKTARDSTVSARKRKLGL